MSLPPAYSRLISDLNRDVQRGQPADILQFCASWFNKRLEHERIAARAHASNSSAPPPLSMSARSAVTPPPSAVSPTGALPPRTNNDHQSQDVQSYRFGGPPSTNHRHHANTQPPMGYSPSSEPNSGPPDHHSRRVSPGSNKPSPAEALAKRASAAIRTSGRDDDDDDDHDDDHDDDDDDDDDDEDSEGGDNVGSSFPPPDIKSKKMRVPVGVNLGRRVSVSAESLTPSAHNAPPLPKVVIPKTGEQRARIEASIKDNLLFRNLDGGQHRDVLNAMKEVKVGRGTEVIVQGAVGDYFYVVEEGSFDVYIRSGHEPPASYSSSNRRMSPGPSPGARNSGSGSATAHMGKKVHTYGPGGSFGELALMYNAPRAATVVATSPSATLWALDRVTFRSILLEHTARKRAMYEQFLSGVSILKSLTSSERSKIADALETKTYGEGEEVVREGEPGHEFYIVESGKAEVAKQRTGGGEDVVGVLEIGDYFGELALINSAPRAATVRVPNGSGKLQVATLGEAAFTRLLGPVLDILSRNAEHYDTVNASMGGAVGAASSGHRGGGGGGGNGYHYNGDGHGSNQQRYSNHSQYSFSGYRPHVISTDR